MQQAEGCSAYAAARSIQLILRGFVVADNSSSSLGAFMCRRAFLGSYSIDCDGDGDNCFCKYVGAAEVRQVLVAEKLTPTTTHSLNNHLVRNRPDARGKGGRAPAPIAGEGSRFVPLRRSYGWRDVEEVRGLQLRDHELRLPPGLVRKKTRRKGHMSTQ